MIDKYLFKSLLLQINKIRQKKHSKIWFSLLCLVNYSYDYGSALLKIYGAIFAFWLQKSGPVISVEGQ